MDAGEDAVRASEASAAPASAGRAGEQTRRAFYKHIKVLMEKADILLVVLDARDPLACRAPAVEALALSLDPPKRVVLVLNKIDLVPPEVVRQWLAYLRRDFPTVAFKASTQQQREHLSSRGGAAVNKATEEGEAPIGAGAAGADTLLQLIKNYSRSHDIKTAVTVGVIGACARACDALRRSPAALLLPSPQATPTSARAVSSTCVVLMPPARALRAAVSQLPPASTPVAESEALQGCRRVPDARLHAHAAGGVARRQGHAH